MSISGLLMAGLIMQGKCQICSADAEDIRAMAQAFIGDKDKMVNMIKTSGSDQVTLKVKIVEMTRNDMKTFGINLQNVTSHGNFGLQLLQGNDIVYHTSNPNINAFSTSW